MNKLKKLSLHAVVICKVIAHFIPFYLNRQFNNSINLHPNNLKFYNFFVVLYLKL